MTNGRIITEKFKYHNLNKQIMSEVEEKDLEQKSLSLATLKDLAKARGLKGVSALRKPELIERMLHEDELESGVRLNTGYRSELGLSERKHGLFRGVRPRVSAGDCEFPAPGRQLDGPPAV